MLNDVKMVAERDYPGLSSGPHFAAAMKAIANIDRSKFVPKRWRSVANLDSPVPIGFAQTITDPFTVALMTAVVGTQAGSHVLEIGTGSGYQSAVLSRLGAIVHSVEIVAPLANQASNRLRRMGYTNVSIRVGDGFAGWSEFAPYDAIIVTAGATAVPGPLLEQLKVGGKLVMPVGPSQDTERLLVFTKGLDGKYITCSLGATIFVPLVGEANTLRSSATAQGETPLCFAGQTAR
jgi:protein-L-isoaspartate(D-aspartate) O-methyltransferase